MIPAEYTFKEPMLKKLRYKPFCVLNGIESEHKWQAISRFTKLDCGPTIKGDRIHPNPFFVRKTDYIMPRGTAKITSGDSFNIVEQISSEGPIQAEGLGLTMPFSLPVFGSMPTPSPALENRATTKLFSALSNQQALNVEALEAAAMQHRRVIDKSYARLDVLSKDLVRRKSRNTRGFTKWLAETWLKKQYLWQPVINNIFESSLAVQQATLRPIYFKISEAEESSTVEFTPFNTIIHPMIPGTATPLEIRRRKRIGIKYVIALTSNPLSVQDFLTLDPANIAWQLVPYSFVVDWIFDVSGWMANRETSTRFFRKFSYGSKTVFWREDVQCSVDNQGTYQCNDSYHVAGKGGGTTKGFSRSVLEQLPAVKPPVIDVSLGSERLLSLAALLGQRLKVPRWADYKLNL